ncbi:MAG: hypothetical protein WBD14_12100 [Phycisphaerae bacterium]
MGEDSRLEGKIKSQITRFASRLTDGWAKPQRRFVGEMLYGLQAAEDVKVSNIARSLAEKVRLIKTENRLCRNLAQTDLTDRINRYLTWEGAGAVQADTVLALDLGDLRKEYAKAMEHLATVRDGSTGALARGYWLCEVIAAHPYGDRIVPLYGELYSCAAEGFESENAVLLRAIERVSQATGGRGIWAMDRGGDRREILIPLLDRRLRFVVRSQGDRHVVLPGGRKCAVREAARWCATDTERVVEVERDGRRTRLVLRLGAMEVRLPECRYTPLHLVVIRGFGPEPILLLTNLTPGSGRNYATFVADVYLTRWKCEEAYRFVKQAYRLEDVRVRSYVALRNVFALVLAVLYFVSVVIGAKAKLNLIFKQVCEKAKRFYEIATFYQYAVADGIHRLLFGSPSGPAPPPPPSDPGQLVLAFAKPPT